jgi:hypothetical protein
MIIMTMDVLAYPASTVGERQPSLEGRRLWEVLFAKYNGRIIVVADKRDNFEHLSVWLKRENFKPSAIDFAYDNGSDAKVERARHLRAVHGGLHWFLDTDPEVIRQTVHDGIPSLLVAVPYVTRPEWHYEKERKPWDELSAELDQQALLRSEERWREL